MATVQGIKAKQGERLDKETIKRVVTLLEQDDPITKKEACDILNIKYNTSRLNKIIERFTEEEQHSKMMRKKFRSKPITKAEEKNIVESKLSGATITELVDRTYRSAAIIKRTLKKYNVPTVTNKVSYFDPVILNDNASKERYKKKDLVFAARYNSPAQVIRESNPSKTHGRVYCIWLYNQHKYANQPWYELADLTPIQEELNVEISDAYTTEEIKILIAEGLMKARKKGKK